MPFPLCLFLAVAFAWHGEGRAQTESEADAGTGQPTEVNRTDGGVAEVKLEELRREVAGIEQQLAQDEARREAEAEAARWRAAESQDAIQVLLQVQDELATGDSDVLDALEHAAPALPFPAQTAVENARAAIESEDLYTARRWISLAIAESQQAQLAP